MMKAFLHVALVGLIAVCGVAPHKLSAQEIAADSASDARPARSPVERLAARRASESQQVQNSVQRDVDAWLPLGGEEFLSQVEPWFANNNREVGELRQRRMNTAKFVAAEKLLRGEVTGPDADVVRRLYLLAFSKLSGTEKKSLVDQFAAEGAWSTLNQEELLAQADRVLVEEIGKERYLFAPAIRRNAARLVLDDQVIRTVDTEVIERLYSLGKRELSDDQQRELRQKLLDLRTLEANASFKQLKTYIELTDLGRPTRQSEEIKRELVAEWAGGQRLGQLETGQQGWLLRYLRPRVNFGPNQQVDVTWSGQLTVPRDGEYRFSVSPIDRNAQLNRDYRKLSIVVKAGGNEVVNAAGTDQETASDWQWQSEPLSLRADQPVSFEHSVSCDQSYRHGMRSEAMGIVASWEGEGIARSVIPAAAFTTAEGEPGLTATYRWTDREGVVHEATGIDANIDCAWAWSGWYLSYENRAMRERLASLLLRSCSKRAALAAADPIDVSNHPVFGKNRKFIGFALESASSETRIDLVDRLCQQSDHFKSVGMGHLCSLWPLASVGVEDQAFDLILAYAAAHANAPCLLDERGVLIQRGRYALMAIELLGCQCDGAIERLESEGLEDEGGNCNLPVAYMCAYGYQNQGKLLEWIEKLDGVLEDSSVTGDKRVNWLLARAMAEEIRGLGQGRFSPRVESRSAGMGYLEEALLIARSDEKKQLIHIERFARFASMGLLDLAETELESINDPAGFRESLSQLQARIAEQQLAEQAARTKSLIGQLKKRRKRATAAGDSETAERYAERIAQLREQL